jgi:hypothetical protein
MDRDEEMQTDFNAKKFLSDYQEAIKNRNWFLVAMSSLVVFVIGMVIAATLWSVVFG